MDGRYIQKANRAVLSIPKQNNGRTSMQGETFKTSSAKEALNGLKRINEKSGVAEGTAAGSTNEEEDFIVVQYNPNSIQYSASAEDQQKDAAEGSGVPKTITAVCTISMSMELLFYRDNEADDSVRRQIEKLFWLMSRSKNRQVRFSWASMVMEGEVSSFSSSFDMFDRYGEPVSGKVQISIQSKEEIEDKSYDNLVDLEENDGGKSKL